MQRIHSRRDQVQRLEGKQTLSCSKREFKLQPKDTKKIITLTISSSRCHVVACSLVFCDDGLVEKEVVAGESYLGISVYRLIFRCKHCHQEIAIKTSPNTERGYALDYGAVQGLDYAAAAPVADNNGRSEASAKQEEEEDQFERLERSTEANKREEDSYRRLEELRLRNAAIDQYTASSSSLLLLKRKRTDKENDAEEKGSSSSDHALWLKAARTTELATTEDEDEKRVTTTTRKATRSSREKASRRSYRPRITAAIDNKAEAAATDQKQDSLVDY
ncbi:hypothetical protein QOT17_013688 [Balamuthia mandrillaris]